MGQGWSNAEEVKLERKKWGGQTVKNPARHHKEFERPSSGFDHRKSRLQARKTKAIPIIMYEIIRT